MNQAETVTILNDMCVFAPPTLIDKRINWEIIDDTTVKAKFEYKTYSVSAVLYFNEEGKLFNFISNDRFETDGKTYNSYPWSTPLSEYKMMNGYFLPGKGKMVYQRQEGEFIYGEVEITSVEYNLDLIQDEKNKR